MRLLLFLLATYGLTAIMIVGCPTEPFRKWVVRRFGKIGDTFVHCYLCMGFWCALACWLIQELISEVPLWILAGAGVAYIINNLTNKDNLPHLGDS